MAGVRKKKTPAQRRYAAKRKKDFNSERYVKLRKFVFARDNFTCQLTGKRGGWLEMHHIYPYLKYPHLRYDSRNLITLSKEAHEMIFEHELEYAEKLWKIAEANQKRADKKWRQN